jgi:hypothetical protein
MTEIWANTLPEAPMENVYFCTESVKEFEHARSAVGC